MKSILIGDYIRQLRKEQHLTQEQLCEGICEPSTLSRIENGRQVPSRSCTVALLQRLGARDERYFCLTSKQEEALEDLKAEIVSCNVGHQNDRGRALLQELENIVEEDDRITQQFILRTRALYGKPDGPYSFEEQLQLLMEAIHRTVPQFDLTEINQYRYSLDEIKVINHIANIYGQHGDLTTEINIYRQLMEYIQIHNRNILQSGGMLPMVAYNYARALGLAQRYQKAIEIAELGQQSCVRYGYYIFLPGLLHIQAECYHSLGNDDKAKDLCRQAYWGYRFIENQDDLETLKQDAKVYFGPDFSFSF